MSEKYDYNQEEVKQVQIQILQEDSYQFKTFSSQFNIVHKNLQKFKAFINQQNVKTEPDSLVKLFYIFQLPFQFSKCILDKMGLSCVTNQLYYQELNQDEYYVHDVHIEQTITFDLNFWRILIYFIELKPNFSLLFGISNQDNNIQIMFDFVQQLAPLINKLPEPPLFYFFISFLSGKNLQLLIKDMNISQSIGRQLYEHSQQFVQKYLDVYNQIDMSQFIIDIFNRIDLEIPHLEDIMQEDDDLSTKLICLKQKLESQPRIFQLSIINLIPSNIYTLYTNDPTEYTLENADILKALSDKHYIQSVAAQKVQYNYSQFQQDNRQKLFKALDKDKDKDKDNTNKLINSIALEFNGQFNSNVEYNSNYQTPFQQDFQNNMMDSQHIHSNYQYLNYFNSNDLQSETSSKHQQNQFISAVKQKPVSVINKNEMTMTNHLKLERNQGMLKLKVLWGKRVYIYGEALSHIWKANNKTSRQKDNISPFTLNQQITSVSNNLDINALQNRYLSTYESNRQLRIFRDEDIIGTMQEITKDNKCIRLIMKDICLYTNNSQGVLVNSKSNGVQKHYAKKKKDRNMLNFLIPSIKKNIHQQYENKKKRGTSSKKKYTTNHHDDEIEETSNFQFVKKIESEKEIKKFNFTDDKPETKPQTKPKTANKNILNLLNGVDPKILNRIHKVSGMMDMSQMVNNNKISSVSSRLIASKTVGL